MINWILCKVVDKNNVVCALVNCRNQKEYNLWNEREKSKGNKLIKITMRECQEIGLKFAKKFNKK